MLNYKRQLIDYLERFIGDLVRRSDTIAGLIHALEPRIDAMLQQVAAREGRDAAPGEIQDQINAQARYRDAWRERWRGLRGWFWPPSRHSTNGAAAAAIARPTSAFWPAGLPPAPTTTRPIDLPAAPLR